MATMMLLSSTKKWTELTAEHASISASTTSSAQSRFHDFRMWDADSVIETQHQFDQMVNECDKSLTRREGW